MRPWKGQTHNRPPDPLNRRGSAPSCWPVFSVWLAACDPDPSSRPASMSGFIARPCHDGRSRSMSALPPELAAPLEELRAKLVEINGSEQNCMTHVVASALQGTSFPEVQAVMAKCRQAAAAAAATAIDTFRHECSEIATQTKSLATAAIVSA